MQIDPQKTVRELVLENPGATRLFEKLNIDYCCGGNRPLSEACAAVGLDTEDVSRQLAAAKNEMLSSNEPNFQTLPLAELSNYIVEKHHTFTRRELERLTALLAKVCSVHGPNHPELLKIQAEFETLRAELEPHMMKEERILFPYIERLERAVSDNVATPFAPFGTVQNPITVMMREHDAAGEILKSIRGLSGDFALPADACISFQTLYSALNELEADLHQHIHLENNLLFPRALQIEIKSNSSAGVV